MIIPLYKFLILLSNQYFKDTLGLIILKKTIFYKEYWCLSYFIFITLPFLRKQYSSKHFHLLYQNIRQAHLLSFLFASLYEDFYKPMVITHIYLLPANRKTFPPYPHLYFFVHSLIQNIHYLCPLLYICCKAY